MPADFAPVARVLMKYGKWLVPVEQRPKGWELLTPVPATELKFSGERSPAPEPVNPKPLLDAAIVETEEKIAASKTEPVAPPKQEKRIRLCPCGLEFGHAGKHGAYSELAEAIRESAKYVGAEPKLRDSALVLVSGMWTRKPSDIEVLTGLPRDFVVTVAVRCLNQKLWCDDRTVVLGELDDKAGDDLEFWIHAMVAEGTLYRTNDGKVGLAEREKRA